MATTTNQEVWLKFKISAVSHAPHPHTHLVPHKCLHWWNGNLFYWVELLYWLSYQTWHYHYHSSHQENHVLLVHAVACLWRRVYDFVACSTTLTTSNKIAVVVAQSVRTWAGSWRVPIPSWINYGKWSCSQCSTEHYQGALEKQLHVSLCVYVFNFTLIDKLY